MNKVILMGRLTRDPEVRYSQGAQSMAVARYTLAVDRRFKRDGEQTADFIQCVAFGKSGEFAERYFHKGTKIVVEGRIQTGSYEKDGQRVYTTDVVVEQQEFAESKASSDNNAGGGGYQQNYQQPAPNPAPSSAVGDGFMNIPDGVDEELPFN
ncbi:single-strand binding protein [Lachnospiraceae bacterium XBB1006]|nr:single-strand binding protein [Lachnospiraceae bacterium XBB1006]